ncbi:DUF221-domain-containing protein [Atractiella rhizophila]|nr:DUF221-domain-containing protein [Atractiella rhizophila]
MSTVTQDEAVSKSTQTFTTALILNSAIALAELCVFLVIRNKFNKIYQPRSFLPLPQKRTSPIPNGLLNFFPSLYRTPSRLIIEKNGLDAYMFVRYLFVMGIKIFFPIWSISWAVLLPVDSVNSGGNGKGLDLFTFGNIGLSSSQQTRYAAHLVLAWVFTIYIFYVLRVELSHYLVKRQQFLISPSHVALPQSRTVLVQGVPPSFLRRSKILKLCDSLPGGVERVWWVRDLGAEKEGTVESQYLKNGKERKKTSMQDDFDQRSKLLNKLEGAETKLLKMATKVAKKQPQGSAAPPDVEKGEPRSLQWVPAKKRPTMKLGFLGLFGEKVDKIQYCREEIARLNKELEYKRERLDAKVVGGDKWEYPRQGGVFILFRDQAAAHIFAQCVLHPTPLHMTNKFINVAPQDVIWPNLSINPYQQKVRAAISWALTLGLIIFWAFPVAFVGLISNVSYLCLKASWLRWLCTLPVPINGIIQGVLPPVALAILFMLLPIVLRLFAKFEGIPLQSLVELSLMKRYFIFLVLHGFLVVTLSSGLVAALPQIANNPASTVNILAENLPKASTFFLTYIVTTGFAGAAGALLQISTLVVYYVKLFILGSTPRSVYGIKFTMSSVQWGTLFPNMSLLAVIGISYMIISPIINGLACVAFIIFYATYKYLFLWVYDMPPSSETGGLFFPLAVQHIFVGLYIQEVCLCGLFFLARDADKKVSAIGEGICMVILIVVTVFYHYILMSGFSPLFEYLPLAMTGDMANAKKILEEQERDQEREKEGNGFANGNSATGRTTATEGNYPRGASVEKERILDDPQYPPGSSNSPNHPTSKLAVAQLEGEQPNAFDHPASYEKQRIVWVPKDPLGLSAEEVRDNQEAGVDASDEGTSMNPKGRVDISRSPPGEPWEDNK